ncbi:MAG: hypothetical protein LRY69_07390 [Gammaproteobacteria bacterium]|nr:hypothetical protein [Gammaproteobacteria bacterium]
MNKLTKALQKKFYEADLIAKNSGLGDEETQVYRHVMMITALANEMSPNNRKALEKNATRIRRAIEKYTLSIDYFRSSDANKQYHLFV